MIDFPRPDFMKLEKRLRVFFIRHGESEGNAQGIMQGLKDFPLSETGRSQSQAAGKWLLDKDIDEVFTSPLIRAKQTAEIIAATLTKPAPTVVNTLRELDAGLFSGCTAAEIQREFPDAWQAFRRHSWEEVPDAESVQSLWDRACSVWNKIIETANSGNRHIAVVTHGGILQWLYKTTIQARPSWMPIMPTANCGIYTFFAHPIPSPEEHIPLSEKQNLQDDAPHLGTSFFASWNELNTVPYEIR